MTMLSPPEPLDALIFRIAAAIADPATEEGELDMWVEAVVTAPLMIVKFDRARTIELKRINEREGFGHQFELLYRSPFDRIFEVVDLQNKIEQELGKAATAKQVETVWCENIDQSGMSEEVNKDFIELAVKIKKKVFFCGDTVRKLKEADDTWLKQSPWDSIYKIEVLCTKLGTHSPFMRCGVG